LKGNKRYFIVLLSVFQGDIFHKKNAGLTIGQIYCLC